MKKGHLWPIRRIYYGYRFIVLLILTITGIINSGGNAAFGGNLGFPDYRETFTVTLIVTDGVDAVEEAFVQLSGYGVQVSGQDGAAVFTDVVPATDISYTITKAGYFTLEGSLDVADSDVTETVVLSLVAYPVTFSVTSQGNPVTGANVSLSGYGNLLTDDNGMAVFEQVVPQADIAYTVTKTGYLNSQGNVSVVNAAVTAEVSLTVITYRVTFNVTDADGPLVNALVDLHGYGILSTDDNGSVMYLNIPPQEGLEYSVIKGGYYTQTGELSIVNSNVVVDVEMVLITHTVTFTITDSEGTLPGATIALGDMEPIVTDETGTAVFEGILPGTFMYYSVTKEHYSTLTGHVTVLHDDLLLDLLMENVVYFELEVGVQGNGTTEPPEGTHTYAQGTMVYLKAFAGEGWVFKKWIIDGSDAGGPNFQINMSGDRQAIAVFEEAPQEIYYDLVLNVFGEGEVEISPESEDGSYLSGTYITLQAFPHEGYQLDSWVVAGTTVIPDAQITVRMVQDITVEAHFGLVTGVDDPTMAEVKIFPVPVVTHMNIEAGDIITEIYLTDISGKTLLHQTPMTDKTLIEMKNLLPGVYFVRIILNDRTVTRTIVFGG